MKLKQLALCLSVISATAFAQPNQDMQKMMEQMQSMQTCMAGIDPSEFAALEQRARQLEAELKSLCKAGKKSAALTKAMAFSREVNSNKAVQQTRKCTAGLDSMIAAMPIPEIPNYDQASIERGDDDICTGM